MVGSELGHYKILSALGAGGMGEVYLADDTKLDRQVAIKVLPESLRSDDTRLERFRREARASASLKHSNIATIYSIEDVGDVLFIVMEYVEGKTLAEHIPSDGMDLEAFFKIFIPLADALAHAHDNGRIHRDIKPGNIMLTEDGTPKILDFGLARIEQEGGDVLESDTPTLTMKEMPPSLTQGRSFLGTPAYMSPEQIEGNKVDARTDIFSFGVVMYEAVTGQRPFKGDTVESVIARILEIDPAPATELKPTSPYMLWQVIRRCLVKEHEERMQTAREMRRELESVQGEMRAGTVLVDANTVATDFAAEEPVKVPFWRQQAAIAGMMFILAIGTITVWYLQPTSSDLPLLKFDLPIPAGVISPDGSMIAYKPNGRNGTAWIRDMDRTTTREIPTTDGAFGLFWSPDSDFLGYVTGQSAVGMSLWKVGVNGGASIPINTMPRGMVIEQPTWGADDRIVFSGRGQGPKGPNNDLYVISTQGGKFRLFLRPDSLRNEWSFTDPTFLPDGKTLAFTVFRTGDSTVTAQLAQWITDDRPGWFGSFLDSYNVVSSNIVVYTEATGIRTLSLPGDFVGLPLYSQSGHILYRQFADIRTNTIWAAPFELESLTVTGAPFRVSSGLIRANVSNNGMLVYGSVSSGGGHQLVWADRSGTVLDTIGQPQTDIVWLALSPDERRVAVEGKEPSGMDIWIHEFDRDIKSRLTFDSSIDTHPSWSPNGDQIAFASMRQQTFDIFLMSPDGSGVVSPLTTGPEVAVAPDWSRNGDYLIYVIRAGDTGADLWTIAMKENGEPVPFLQTSFNEDLPQISPNGKHVAYVSDESGQPQVYVRSFPSGSGKVPVSTDGGTAPKWNGRGDELFYIEDNTLMAVSVETHTTFRPGPPRPLFTGEKVQAHLVDNVDVFGRPRYDVSADGQRFVVSQWIGDLTTQKTTVVQNWIKEFENRE
jgi:eukaryotic-like serine/threonine-protein kinase